MHEARGNAAGGGTSNRDWWPVRSGQQSHEFHRTRAAGDTLGTQPVGLGNRQTKPAVIRVRVAIQRSQGAGGRLDRETARGDSKLVLAQLDHPFDAGHVLLRQRIHRQPGDGVTG